MEEEHEERGYRYREQQKKDMRGAGAVWCFMLVFLLVAAVALSGLVLSVIEFSRDPGPEVSVKDHRAGPYHDYANEDHDHDHDHDDEDHDDYYEEMEYVAGPYNPDEIWLIQFDVGGGNLEYVDQDTGHIKGFNMDVVNAVCRKANKNCRIVFDSYSRCWSDGYGAEGLMGRFYHACAGWRIASDRLLTYKFTDPFQKTIPAYFVTSQSSGQFDSTDVTGKRIGFLEGWFSDEGCLNRQDGIEGLPLNNDQKKTYPSAYALEVALMAGEIDAAFIAADNPAVNRNNIVSDEIHCLVEGAGLMMRKDTHLEKWWNPAWRALQASDEYREICDDLERVHGNRPGLPRELICRDKDEDLHSYRRRKR